MSFTYDETNESIGLWRTMIWIFPSDDIENIKYYLF